MTLIELRNLADKDAAFPGRVTAAVERALFPKVAAGTLTAAEKLFTKAAIKEKSAVTDIVMITVFNVFDSANPSATPQDLFNVSDEGLVALVSASLPYVINLFYAE